MNRENNLVRDHVEPKKKQIAQKDAVIDELESKITRPEFLSSEIEKVLAMLHVVLTLPHMKRF